MSGTVYLFYQRKHCVQKAIFLFSYFSLGSTVSETLGCRGGKRREITMFELLGSGNEADLHCGTVLFTPQVVELDCSPAYAVNCIRV